MYRGQCAEGRTVPNAPLGHSVRWKRGQALGDEPGGNIVESRKMCMQMSPSTHPLRTLDLAVKLQPEPQLERLQEEFEDVEQQVINRDRIIEALRDELQQLKTQREAALESIQQKKAFKVSPDKQAKGSPDKSAKLQVEVRPLG